MSDQDTATLSSNNQASISEPPPSGDPEKAEKYIDQLVNLLSEDKLIVSHTDLSRFDPSSLEDHYRIDLDDYQVEVSHSKQPNTGKDSYVILFTNLKSVEAGACEKVILAYIHLRDDQFKKFKLVADDQIERKLKEEQEKKLKEALKPIDNILENLNTARDDVISKETVKEETPEGFVEETATPAVLTVQEPLETEPKTDHPAIS